MPSSWLQPGLERLQKTAAIRERFAPEVLCPAPGQGALAIECRAGDRPMHAALQPLEDRDTRLAITAERRCLAALGGGCLVPIGAYCHRSGDELSLRAVVASADGRQIICAAARHTDPETLGEQLAQQLLDQGAGAILKLEERAGMSTAQPLAGRRILITRARHQAGRLAEALEAQGAEVLRLPTIEIVPPETYAHLDAVLEVISGFDWLIVTSANGAAALADRMQFLRMPPERLKHLQVAAIGPATAAALGRIGLKVSAMPEEYVAEAVVAMLKEKVAGTARSAGACGRGP